MTDRPRFREGLPQLKGGLFLTDGGIETTLIFHRGIDLPHFAAFHLLGNTGMNAFFEDYYAPYLDIAQRAKFGFVLETITWRASEDWGKRLGYSKSALAEANREAVARNLSLRTKRENSMGPIVLSGCVGPRGDGYVPSDAMTSHEARSYHEQQIGTLAETSIDVITAATLNYSEEAIGIAMAAKEAKVPVVLSFTVETDGHLPTGQPLEDAISEVDQATDGYVSYFGINCAHPTHFAHLFEGEAAWAKRIRAIRANASRMSHTELESATELDEGDPNRFGEEYQELRSNASQLNVLGGCCGTDHRHVAAIARGCDGHTSN